MMCCKNELTSFPHEYLLHIFNLGFHKALKRCPFIIGDYSMQEITVEIVPFTSEKMKKIELPCKSCTSAFKEWPT